jgi:hypothetical protein
MAHLTRWGPLAALLLTASSASAQVIDARGVPYRQWDFAASVGVLTSLEAGDFLTERDDWSATWTVEGDIGRFWTSHVKTEAGGRLRAAPSRLWLGAGADLGGHRRVRGL